MRINEYNPAKHTYGGGKAASLSVEEELKRSVLTCLLWENNFYESGEAIADRIRKLANQCSMEYVAELAIEARHTHGLRHAPLWLLVSMIERGGKIVGETIEKVITRADELGELVALYQLDGHKPITKQMKVGLGNALKKFNEYQLAKYRKAHGGISLRQVMFLCHPKPVNTAQAEVWKRLANKQLAPPDTWEVALSTGGNKKEEFTRLLQEGKLGYLALLRNLRKMVEVGVDHALIRQAILNQNTAHKILPFQFISAAQQAPQFEQELQNAMLCRLHNEPKLGGKTLIVVDVSGSMFAPLSMRSNMTRLLASAGLAAILHEVCEEAVIYATAGSDRTRIHKTALVPARHGMALIEKIDNMKSNLGGGGIFLNQAMQYIGRSEPTEFDRVVVITDEQDCSIKADDAPDQAPLLGGRNYIINVAPYNFGIAYKKWLHINGFSTHAVRFINQWEASVQAAF